MSDIYRRCGCRENGKQLGSACPRLSDPKHGSWTFVVQGGSDPGTGKRIQIRKSGFITKKEATLERAKVVDSLASGRYRADVKLTVAEWFPMWLARREGEGLKASTAFGYRRYIDGDIVPALGRLKLTEVRRFHVDTFLRDLTAAGRGATTVRRIHAVLSSALTAAQRLDLIGENPSSKVALPRPQKVKIRPWQPEQARTFLDAIAAHRLAPLFELTIHTGLRRGELAGLRWEDVDLLLSRLVVRQARVQVGRTVVTNTVKTEHGQDRRVSIGAEAVGALLAWRLRQDEERATAGEAWQEDGWVFTYEDGRPLRPAHISRVFDTIVAKSGLPKLSFHGLRHEHASLLLSAGVPIAAVSKRLGHSTIAITSDLYSHLLDDADRNMAEAIATVIPKRSSEVQ